MNRSKRRRDIHGLVPYALPQWGRGASIIGAGWEVRSIPFSAFWLRSSVVSVLISLISDTRLIEPHDINLIFLGCGSIRQLAARARLRRLGIALPPSLAQPSSLSRGNQLKPKLQSIYSHLPIKTPEWTCLQLTNMKITRMSPRSQERFHFLLVQHSETWTCLLAMHGHWGTTLRLPCCLRLTVLHASGLFADPEAMLFSSTMLNFMCIHCWVLRNEIGEDWAYRLVLTRNASTINLNQM